MAVAFDAATPLSQATNSPWSITHTCTGSDRLLVVCVQIFADASQTITGITYNSVALTKANSVQTPDKSRSELWYLVNPSSGSNTVSITFSAFAQGLATAISFTGASGVGTPAVANATGTAPTVDVTSVSGGMVVDSMVHYGSADTVGAGQTERSNQTRASWIDGSTSTEPGAASVTMSWSNAGSSQWGIVALPISPVASVSVAGRKLLLGVGA